MINVGDEEEEEEEEPKLKYQRLGASVPGILKEDIAKCLVAHDKFLVTNSHHHTRRLLQCQLILFSC